jgi:hypothetical protein
MKNMPRLLLVEGLPKYEGTNEAEAPATALRIMIKVMTEEQLKA